MMLLLSIETSWFGLPPKVIDLLLWSLRVHFLQHCNGSHLSLLPPLPGVVVVKRRSRWNVPQTHTPPAMRTVVCALVIAAALIAVGSAQPQQEGVPIPNEVADGLPSVKEGDEEYHSRVAPTHMRCDTCSAAAFWIHRALKLAHKEKFLKRLRTDVVYDAIDDVCLPKTFSRTYGIKNVNGRHRLSGGGLKWFYTQAPAVGTLMPGQWLNHMCREIQGEFGEDDLYDMFWKYHVKQALENSDVPFFRDVCIRRMKKCTEKEALESYDDYAGASKETREAK